ncbi:hypothetical protein [Frigoriglobus tundricola]|uniref:PEP-CTERM protein-sorting domain-containing protein n=1 Tax=Frigoriglobus tundricola TaxID=2774151 RepID=A0A6M5YHV2_9BACT|nr:hypothetical protein [Frigoriglobus tundricola]QJW93548.1 hypothetical protein FTUN_1055 [Frigoriglobus tundricola]
MKRPRLVPLVRGVLVAIATCAATSSARADLTLEFGSGSQTYTASVANGTSATSVTVGDFTVAYTVHFAEVPSYVFGIPGGYADTLSLDVTAVKGSTSGASNNLSFDLINTGLATPFPEGPAGYTLLTSYVTANSVSGSSGTQVGTDEIYSSPPMAPLQLSSGTFTYGAAPNGGAIAFDFLNGIGAPFYSLETRGAEIDAVNGGSVGFTASAQIIFVPEPSGVTAALTGFPCMGLVLALGHRLRRAGQVATAA